MNFYPLVSFSRTHIHTFKHTNRVKLTRVAPAGSVHTCHPALMTNRATVIRASVLL